MKDQITEAFGRMNLRQCIDKLNRAWGGWQDEILKIYTAKLRPLPPLSQQKQFKSVRTW